MPQPIQYDAAHLDLSARFISSSTVSASPATNAETTIATLTLAGDLGIQTGVLLIAQCSFTAGTSGTAATMKIRRTNTSGATIVTSGATTVVATQVYQPTLLGIDPNPVPNTTVYVVTLTITGGAATSTVSAVNVIAVPI